MDICLFDKRSKTRGPDLGEVARIQRTKSGTLYIETDLAFEIHIEFSDEDQKMMAHWLLELAKLRVEKRQKAEQRRKTKAEAQRAAKEAQILPEGHY